ncbi:hypothetical protein TrLO_g3018 [Triparma laevis f. longispina]|uniref:Uncharacterized protein n=1 Tax=Triparma laevis f. longispina TaxID=1714387 RepID=A0A9W7E7E2_9STRA|nr:hypothetical protein TrLO_g3018 [Triparma laevis f. longispina]
MTIPDSLQKLGDWVFAGNSKLVPSSINPDDEDAVVAHLRSKQQQKEKRKVAERIQKQQQMEAERVKQENKDVRARRL